MQRYVSPREDGRQSEEHIATADRQRWWDWDGAESTTEHPPQTSTAHAERYCYGYSADEHDWGYGSVEKTCLYGSWVTVV